MNKYEKILIIIFSAVISVLFLFKVTNMAFASSKYPFIKLAMVMFLLAVTIVLLVLKRKEYFVYLFLLSYPFLTIEIKSISLLEIFSCILLIIFFKEIIFYIRNNRDIFRVPFFIIAFSIIYTTLFANYPKPAFEKALILLSLFNIYIILSICFRSRVNRKTASVMLFAVLLLCVAISAIQIVFGISSVKLFLGDYNQNVGLHRYVKRIPSVFQEAQTAGLYFAFMTFLGAGFNAVFFKNKWFVKIFLVASLFALLTTGTRIAILSLLCGFIFFQCITMSFKKMFVFLLLTVSLLIAGSTIYNHVIPYQTKGRFESHALGKSFLFRYKLWAESFPIITHNPFGVGMGGENIYDAGFAQGVHFLYGFKSDPNLRGFTHFENTYLDILYSLGIVGFVGILMFFIKFFTAGFSCNRLITDPVEKKWPLYLLSAMIIWMISVFTSPQLFDPHPMMLFIFLLAMMNSLRYDCYQKQQREL